MRSWAPLLIVGAIVAAVTASAADNVQVVKERQATMKEQAKAMGRIKGFLIGKMDQAAAQAAATDLSQTMRKIPSLFPEGSDTPSPDGKYGPKPAIWSQWNQFLAARNNAATKVDALAAAVKSGDKNAIQAAFVDLGKNGCGGCHGKFRQTLKQ